MPNINSLPASRQAKSPSLSLQSARNLARTWAQQLEPQRRQPAAWSLMSKAVETYVHVVGGTPGITPQVSPVAVVLTYELDQIAERIAQNLGAAAAALPLEQACYGLSACYTALLPDDIRSTWGAYYTPPALTDRLTAMATEAGTNWRTARVLDPACGGGAFLLPAALRMRDALGNLGSKELIDHFAHHLQGFEIDPFAAWLTQAWLEIAFAKELTETSQRFPNVVRVGDSLVQPIEEPLFDLVIGNPPYGRIRLAPELREHYHRSLFGHANLYGLFTDLALRWTRKGGVVAYVTPTSFFAGEYFKALRTLLSEEAPPFAVDFLTSRKGVFDDVLQEALLATYRRGGKHKKAEVHYLSLESAGEARIAQAGTFDLPKSPAAPWLAPRYPEQRALVAAISHMPLRLSDWGYGVSTGQLVWNRFKEQFRDAKAGGLLPVVWAEAVSSDGQFAFRAERRGHKPYFELRAQDNWLVTREPCVLLQRTTAKEQQRRLIAAEMPASFLKRHGRVIVENHLNMVRPNGPTKVSRAAIVAFFNSTIADEIFRCISGSVAVSAFELEALPLPSVNEMSVIEELVRGKASQTEIDHALRAIYECFGA